MWDSLSITDHTALTMVTLSLDLTMLAESHQPIVDAIAAGDVELACRVSREHQQWFVELLNAQAEPREAAAQVPSRWPAYRRDAQGSSANTSITS
jgi:DNA-binding GntR family transcriptional regulator